MGRENKEGLWFGVVRSLEEQMLGLQPALKAARGKTVADFGCAEGLISLEFIKAGAQSVYACDYNSDFINIAKGHRERLPKEYSDHVQFYHADLRVVTREERARPTVFQYDIVLALAIIHKMPDPQDTTRFLAQSCRSLLVVRLPRKSSGQFRSKHIPHALFDINAAMPTFGFTLERTEPGPRKERVQYWRRNGDR